MSMRAWLASPDRESALGSCASGRALPGFKKYRITPESVFPVRPQLRTWKDPAGRTWKLFLSERDTYRPGALLVFTGDPKDGMGSPKILVRGLQDVYSVPDPTLPFYFAAAEHGGFVWRDGDGVPWHISNRTRAYAESGRLLEIHHAGSHRSLWELSDEELGRLVRQSTGPTEAVTEE